MLQPRHSAAPSSSSPVDTDVVSSAQRLLQQGRPEDAFLAAKQALDASRPDDEGVTCQLWSLLGRSLEALGTLTAAYALVMKGAQRMQGRGLGIGSSCSQHPSTAPLSEPCRIHCLSDVHVDRPGGRNLQALRSISSTAFLQDVLLVAGDLGDTLTAVRLALETLRPRFKRVVFVPGNHDLWLRPDSWDARHFPDSFCKLWAILDLCKELGVDTGPLALPMQDTGTAPLPADGSRSAVGSTDTAVWIVPLLSWYSCTFDATDPRPGHYLFDAFCKWPIWDLDVWQVMLRLNIGAVTRVQTCLKGRDKEGSHDGRQRDAQELGPDSAQGGGFASRSVGQSGGGSEAQRPLSHFLPHPELPFSPFQPELAKAVGCTELQAQLEELRADVHVYGHSHVNVDVVLDDASSRSSTARRHGQGRARRYIQHALEAELGGPSLYTIWDGRRVVGQRTACADGKPLAAR